MSAQEDFERIKHQVVDPIQHDYEAIRPVVLFSETAAARSLKTGIERTVLGDKARRFILEGMLGLADGRPGAAGRKGHVYPDDIAAHILYLKQVYPPIHWREIVRILERKFGYHTNHHTLKRFVDRHGLPVQLELDLPVFADFADAYQARWTVVRMAYEDWNKSSIAGCLKFPVVMSIISCRPSSEMALQASKTIGHSPLHIQAISSACRFSKKSWTCNVSILGLAAFAFTACLNNNVTSRLRVNVPWDAPWRSIASSMAPPVRGEAPRTTSPTNRVPNTCPIALNIAITCGLSTSATWSN
jgi:hypothetical protein